MVFLGLAISMLSCETESSRNLGLNTNFLSLKPSNNYSKLFANGNGDTVSVYLSANEAGTQNFDDGYQLGALGNGKTSVETRTYILSCDTPYIRFNYQFYIGSNAADFRAYSDFLTLAIEDSNGGLGEMIAFRYQNDTVYLQSSNTVYRDSLTLIGQSFTEVFNPNISDPNENLLFYFKLNSGLVGFRTRDGIIYELVN